MFMWMRTRSWGANTILPICSSGHRESRKEGVRERKWRVIRDEWMAPKYGDHWQELDPAAEIKKRAGRLWRLARNFPVEVVTAAGRWTPASPWGRGRLRIQPLGHRSTTYSHQPR